MAQKLGTGDQLPTLNLNLTDGSSLALPQDLDTPYSIFLIYRGHW